MMDTRRTFRKNVDKACKNVICRSLRVGGCLKKTQLETGQGQGIESNPLLLVSMELKCISEIMELIED